VGVLKGILSVVLGFFLLGGVGPKGFTAVGVAGIALNCAGGVWWVGGSRAVMRSSMTTC
jgi:solute carrier family 35 protein